MNAGRPCTYSQNITWGGRPFKKSRFGKCLNAGARRLESSSGSHRSGNVDFVYGVQAQTLEVVTPRQERQVDDYRASDPEPTIGVNSPEVVLPLEIVEAQPQCLQNDCRDFALQDVAFLRLTPAVTNAERALLSYFLDGMSKVISCHDGVQGELCSAVLPIALATPHLLAAIMALAEAHRLSAGLQTDPEGFERCRSKSIRLLRPAIGRGEDSEAILATILMLCIAEIASPTTAVTGWQTHLRGASAILTTSLSSSQVHNAILYRLYRSFQGVALACGMGMEMKENDEDELSFPSDGMSMSDEFDDLAGFSTYLFPIFRAVHNLSTLSREDDGSFTCVSPPGVPHLECTSHVTHHSHILFDHIRTRLQERKSKAWSRVNARDDLPCRIRQDFDLLDEAYHHFALLQIHVNGSLSVPMSLYHESKSRLLSCLAAISYDRAPCPGVAALPPLFAAGCLACDPVEQDIVRDILRKLWVNFSMGNVPATKRFLEKLWQKTSRPRDDEGRDPRAAESSFSICHMTAGEVRHLPLSKAGVSCLGTLPY